MVAGSHEDPAGARRQIGAAQLHLSAGRLQSLQALLERSWRRRPPASAGASYRRVQPQLTETEAHVDSGSGAVIEYRQVVRDVGDRPVKLPRAEPGPNPDRS